jgi:type 1 fimbria pilin
MKNKMLAAFAILIVSLAVIGFSYAAWTQTIYVTGNATFGTLDLLWSNYQPNSSSSPAVSFSASISGDQQTITVNLGNVYPGAYVSFWLETTNYGTLPVRYYNFQCTGTTDNTLDSHFTLTFYDPLSNPNIWATFAQWQGTTHVYDDWGIGHQYITFGPGVSHWNLVSISIDNDVPYVGGGTYTAYFTLTGVLGTS